MRAAAFGLVVALLLADLSFAQQRRRYVESPAAQPYREGIRLLADEHWAEAAEFFERAIDLDSTYALAFYGLGRARIGQKQYVAAVGALERCAALYRAQAADRSSQQMDLRQQRQDQIHELRDHIRNLLAGPQTPARQVEVERTQDQIQDLELSMREGIDDVRLQVPAFVSLSLGSAHFRRGSMADAEREYRNAIAANPRMGEAHNNLAVVLLLTGRADEAEKSVKEAEKRGVRVPQRLKDDIRRSKNTRGI